MRIYLDPVGRAVRDDEFGLLFFLRHSCESGRETPMFAKRKIASLAATLWLATSPLANAQLLTARKIVSDVLVHVRTEVSGDVSISAWSRSAGRELIPVLPEIIHCQGGEKQDSVGPNGIVCSKALQRDGLALEGVVDLAPIARSLDPTTKVELWLGAPRLGFDSTSMPMTEEDGTATLWSRSIQFEAGSAPPAIRYRFGYRPDQLAGIYLPLVLLALALTLITAIMARAGLAALSRSAVLLGTIVWMGAAAQLDAGGPLRILLYENRFASLAALLVEFWPPLLCIALGVALGGKMRIGQPQNGKTGEVLRSQVVIPLLLTCAVGSLPSITTGDWPIAAIWLAAAPILLILRRAWIRGRARSRVVQMSGGELKERVSALAAKAGWRQVRLYISFSARSEVANAFALPGRSIFLTGPLVRSLSKREVDAVAAHELSHFRHSNRGVWAPLFLAMILCETPARDLLLFWPGGLFVAMLLPIAVFFVSLHGTRKREFAADAGAVALTGDPRAMISSLARIARNNGPMQMNAMAEWFSSHPTTPKRIRALAAAARLDPAEVENLCSSDDPGERYELPQEKDVAPIFTPAWQKVNAGIYGWVVIFSSCGAGLFVAWLLERSTRTRFGGYGVAQLLGGIALGCIVTKALAAASMSSNYARLRRRLEARLGFSGKLVGLAIDSEPRLYNGFRFSDAGLLRFNRGRLCYQSERIAIELNPADVVEVAMVAASPSTWMRQAPMVRFRQPESGSLQSFILHPVAWLPRQRRLLKSIERWRATGRSPESTPERTSISGFNPVAGQPFTNPTIAEMARGFLVPGCATLGAAILTRWNLRADWGYVGCALVVAACSHAFLYLPAMLYRAPALPTGQTAPVDAN
jgi:Zn-dependent protease with chaperone function